MLLRRRYVSGSSPVIVGGSGRSGTTILRVMLDSHPRLCCGPESNLFVKRKLDDERIEHLAWSFDLDLEMLRGLRDSTSHHAEFVERFFHAYAEARERPRWADKTPKNVTELDWIFKHFPQARFVHVVRDGRDVACSLRTHPRYEWVDGEQRPTGIRRSIRKCIARWRDDVRAGLRYRDDPRCTEVRYEELLADPEQTLGRLLDFLGEPWDDAVLRHHEFGGGSRDSRRFPQNPEATKPLQSGAQGRWQKDLAPDEVRLFKSMAGKLLVDLGYERDLDWERAA